ncbi:MAG TPA: endonuclease [Pseudonocardiaceae bacterium]|jgi:hypothetical protein|nr:endonuclease [Pseudonocardiaceae bacterium]
MSGSAPTPSLSDLLAEHGTTYAAQAGITLRDKPSPLYELLVLTTLLSVRIRAEIAVAAAHELFTAGWRTPTGMLDSTWQQRVDAVGRGGYARYDESTARYLADSAQQLLDSYGGDLRELRAAAAGDLSELRRRLREFPRIGETGAHIFCREAQAVWPELRPYFDRRALTTAGTLGLPTDPAQLGALVEPDRLANLAAALVRVNLRGTHTAKTRR